MRMDCCDESATLIDAELIFDDVGHNQECLD